MANIARIRVELKRKYNDPEKNFKDMFHEFKRRVNSSGIMHAYKEHQYFESKSQKDRKKRKESAAKRQMELIEEKLALGERVDAPAGLIRKVLAKQWKDQEKDDKKKKYRDHS